MILGRLGLSLVCAISVTILVRGVATASWPEVAPFSANIYFGDADSASATFTIFDLRGGPAYLLECHAWTYQDPEFDYSGDWECRLRSTQEKHAYSTLLTDVPHPTRDWQSRARFLADQLVEKCAEYPEYARLRHFRLRGMKLTFLLEDIQFRTQAVPSLPGIERPAFKAFRFKLEVERDPSATSEIAESVPFVEPPYLHPESRGDYGRDCDHVKKR